MIPKNGKLHSLKKVLGRLFGQIPQTLCHLWFSGLVGIFRHAEHETDGGIINKDNILIKTFLRSVVFGPCKESHSTVSETGDAQRKNSLPFCIGVTEVIAAGVRPRLLPEGQR